MQITQKDLVSMQFNLFHIIRKLWQNSQQLRRMYFTICVIFKNFGQISPVLCTYEKCQRKERYTVNLDLSERKHDKFIFCFKMILTAIKFFIHYTTVSSVLYNSFRNFSARYYISDKFWDNLLSIKHISNISIIIRHM